MIPTYYTTACYDESNFNNIHYEVEKNCKECKYYVEAMIPRINIEEWKNREEVINPVFVKISPDHEEITCGILYIIKYFGED
tara:strand:- start:1412 stop:1657 length:246 start_codon:yes stop_codon:yes gene_type:complete